MGPIEPVVGLEVLRSLVKISLSITFQPTGLLTSLLHGQFGMRKTCCGLSLQLLRKKEGVYLGLLTADFLYEKHET